MRHPLAIPVLLALAALVGYAAAARPVQAQAPAFPLQVGENVLFSFQGGSSRECRIEEIRAVFARCGEPSERGGSTIGRPARREAPEQWVNVAVVEWVTKGGERR